MIRLREPRYNPDGTPHTPMLPRDAVNFGLALVFLLALLLRLFHLGTHGFWVDEMLTLNQGQVPGYSLWTQFLDDAQAALPMLLSTFMSEVSTDEVWLRLPSALVGAFTIPLIFELVRRYATDRAALIAALMLALSPMHIDHCQELRGYSFLLFFGVAATLMVLDAPSRPGWRQYFMLLLLGVAAGLSNLQGLLWVGGIAVGLAVSGRVSFADLTRWAPPFLLVALVLSPWWWTTFQVHETTRLLPGAETGPALRDTATWSLWALPWAGYVLSFGRTAGPTVVQLHEGIRPTWPVLVQAVLGALVVLPLFLLGVRRLGRRAVEPLAWTSLVVVVAVVLATRNVKPFNPRYVIAALPVLLLFVSVGLDGLRPSAARLFLLLWFGLTAVSLGHYYFDGAYQHEDVRGAAYHIRGRGGADDVVLVPTVKMVFDHYNQGRQLTATLQPGEVDGAESMDDLMATIAPERDFLWYVEARPWVHDPEGRLHDWLASHYRRVSATRLDGVTVSLYDRRSGAADEE